MKGKKILIVEDELITATDIQHHLEKEGYQVTGITKNRSSTLKLIESDLPDLILMDIVLEDSVNGVEIAREIRERYDIPIIFLTAHGDQKIVEEARKTEPFCYIIKPFTPRELFSNVEIALYKHEVELEHRRIQNWLTTTLRSIADAVITVDQQGKINFLNVAAEKMLGYPEKEILNTLLEEILTLVREENEVNLDIKNIIFSRKQVTLDHIWLISRDSQQIPIRGTIAPIIDQNENFLGAVFTFQDITVEKERNQRLYELSRFPEENPYPVLKIDQENKITYANPVARDFLKLFSLKTGAHLKSGEIADLITNCRNSGKPLQSTVKKKDKFYHLYSVPIGKGDFFYLYAMDITEREKAHLELKQSEERYRELINSFPYPLLIIRDFTIIFLNEKALSAFGAKRFEEVLGSSIYNFINSEEKKKFRELLDQLQKKGGGIFRLTAKRLDGSIFPAEIVVSKITYYGELAFQIIAIDISNQVLTRARMESQASLIRTLFNSIPDITYYKDINGKYLVINSALMKLTGLKEEEIIGKTDFDIFPEHLALQCVSSDKKVLESRKVYISEEALEFNGETIYFETIKTPAFDSQGKLVGIVGISRDITIRKEHEEALRERNFEYQTFLDNSQIGIWRIGYSKPIDINQAPEKIVDEMLEHGKYIECNSALVKMYRAESPDFLIGKTVKEATSDLQILRERTLEFVKNGFKSESIEEKDVDLEQNIHYFIQSYFGYIKDNHLRWIWGIQFDITERKQSEILSKAVYKISRAVTISRNMDELFLAVYLIINEIMPASNFYIALYNPERQELSFPYYTSKQEKIPRTIKFGTGITEYVISTGEPLLVRKNEFKNLINERKITLRGKLPEVWLGVPLKFENKVMGVIALQDFSDPGAYTEFHKDILEYISSEVARSIVYMKTAEALRESERKYRTLVNHSPFSIFVHHSGVILLANRAFLNFLGLKHEREVINKNILELVHPDMSEKARQLINKRKKTSDIFHYEVEFKSRNGSIKYLEVTSIPIDYEEKSASLVMFQDITERKEAEMKRREYEESYRNLFNSVGEAIYIQDKNGYFLDVNKGAEEMYGYPRSYFVGKTPEFLSAPGKNDLPAVQKCVEKAFNGEPQQFEFWGLRKNGEAFPKDVRLYPGTYFGEKVVIAIARDISERKNAEMLLKESEEKYRTIIENSLEGIYIVQDNRIQFCNQQFARIFGYETPEEVIGKHFLDLVTDSDRDLVLEKVEKRIQGMTKSEHYTFKGKKKDGSEFFCETLGSLINYRGKPAIQGALRDISEQKRLEEELRHSQKMEAVGQLSAGIAHDFNNILTAIMGAADMALMEVTKGSLLESDLLEIKSAAQRAANLTQQLLAFSKKQIRSIKTLNLNDVIKNSYHMLRRTVDEDIAINLKLSPEKLIIKADQNQIEQILFNLVINARDAIRDKGLQAREKEITIRTESIYVQNAKFTGLELKGGLPGFAQITVSDTGTGIPDEIVDKIFDPFFTTKGVGKGTGMGLASVYGIVKQNDGHIYLDTKPGKGTTFYILWPLKDIKVERETESIEKGAIAGGNETILIVEDEPHVLKLTEKVLSRLGYKTITAQNGGEALEKLSELQDEIDLLITDVVMPRMDGIELANKLEENYPGLKVLFISGYSKYYKQLSELRSKNRAFLEKPYTKDQLARAIRKLLDQG